LLAAATIERITGLRNRRAFQDDLERELQRANRTGRAASIALVAARPPAGDPPATAAPAGLELAAPIEGAIRTVDAAYRIGEHEYALLLPETRASAAEAAVHRVRDALRGAGATDIHAGVAEAGPGVDRDALLRNAQAAITWARAEGRTDAVVFSPELAEAPLRGAPGTVARRASR
jgi:PleD family two-component response regulator